MMRIPPEVKCKVCANVFCCVDCRSRHEENKHFNDTKLNCKSIEISCAICKQEPFLLTPHLPDELLRHISQHHLPLQCRKCSKIFTTKMHFSENTKCYKTNPSCKLETISSINVSSDKKQQVVYSSSTNDNNQQSIAVATQTSPCLTNPIIQENEDVLTPVSLFQMQWRTKIVADENITDSVSSVKNVSSSIDVSSQKPPNLKSVNLTRTTSTPMQALLLKVKEKNFDSSSCQVSSIHSSSSESDVSPSIKNNSTAFSPGTGKPNEKLKRPKGRGKMPVSATPLRQVMSKSIQRAIAEHGTINHRDKGVQPKKIFDSTNGYSLTSPLDLRTSPAIRRTQSEVVDRSSTYEEFHAARTSSRKQILSSTKHIVTEDLIISSSATSSNNVFEKLETVYETCRSIETSSSLFTSEARLNPNITKNLLHITPKMMGGNLKKAISFETPEVTCNDYEDGDDNDDVDDVFYTPLSLSHSSRKSLITNNGPHVSRIPLHAFRASSDAKVAKETSTGGSKEPAKTESGGGKLWSLVSSVLRLASFGSDSEMKTESSRKNGPSAVVKRCASFTGILTGTSSTDDDPITQHAKRKRTNTVDSYSISCEAHTIGTQQGPSKRLKRIQGRKPIERMRNATQNF